MPHRYASNPKKVSAFWRKMNCNQTIHCKMHISGISCPWYEIIFNVIARDAINIKREVSFSPLTRAIQVQKYTLLIAWLLARRIFRSSRGFRVAINRRPGDMLGYYFHARPTISSLHADVARGPDEDESVDELHIRRESLSRLGE